MTDWLLDTLLWTAVLIGFVLLVRRPVANTFGPQVAYALWALPMLRLVLPPIQLPAWLAPATRPDPVAETTTTFLIREPATNVATPEAVAAPLNGSGSAAPGELTAWTAQGLFETIPWSQLALGVWVIGAAIFLYLRFGAYFRLREELLAEAREVGRDGPIRLIETPGTRAPLAFGVLDPVIALPPGFMAQQDRNARDLALAHELAHHRGRDLLINVAVQPLFAMHWWNPLGRYGWLALRRDQEAACDARVIASKPAEARAAYATVIAGFAAGPHLSQRAALTAPMACPVLGEKSIIQRLRSLNMSDTSPRRRMAGRAMLGAAVLALPLTASISYAEVNAPPAPAAPAAPGVAAAPPAPPVPPVPPAVLVAQEITKIDPDAEVIESEDGKKIIIKRIVDEDGDGTKEKHVEKQVRIINRGEKMSDEELEKMMAELRAGLAEADKAIKDVPHIVKRAMIDMDIDGADGKRTIVKMECGGDGVATVEEGETRKVFICQSEIMAEALEGLREARNEIAKDKEMDAKMRDKIVQELDRHIAEWKKNKG